MPQKHPRWSRRNLLRAAASGGAVALAGAEILSPALAAERVRAKISDVRTMTVQGPGRTYVYVKVETKDGAFGIAEAYGTPGIGVAEQIEAIKPALIGKDPLEIDKLYTFMGDGASGLFGSRTDGSAHQLMRAASGIEMALWDLAGRLLDTPTCVLLGGRFRDKVRVYDHSKPRDPLDKASCREWADKVRAHPSGFTAHKIDIPRTLAPGETGKGLPDAGKDPGNRRLTTQELRQIGQAFENMREAIGWDHDLMVHCHWELDLPSALQLAQIVAPVRPLWLEDPLGVDYNDSWKLLAARSPVPILTGENLARREGFLPFLVNQGAQIVNPDLRNSGGFLETKRIADMASVWGVPLTTHNTASQLHTWQICQWAASVRDFLMCETVTGEGGWMDQVLKLDGPYIDKGYITVGDKPGTGVELNRDIVEAHLAPGQRWWGA
jgi:L-alanine-DL-glutamate epimerase-like enolase superfamily enzyme